jgi:hypothetical protein
MNALLLFDQSVQRVQEPILNDTPALSSGRRARIPSTGAC